MYFCQVMTEIIVLEQNDVNFPKKLLSIHNPPIRLYVKGDVTILKDKGVAIIGTRNPTEYGKKAAYRLSEIFTNNGFNIISGLALGCDTHAHEGCLNANGKTIAILAHGLDVIYPKENKKLSEKILENGGCLISEYPINTKIEKYNFINRNRLQSGLSCGIIVIETDITGGTMHTVNHAIKQNKLIGVLGGHSEKYINENSIKGNYKLLENKEYYKLSSPREIDNFILKLNQC